MCTDTPAFRSLPHCAQEPRSQTAAGSHGKDAVFSMCFSVTWSQMFPGVPRCSQGPTDLPSSLHPLRRSLPPPLSLRRWSCGWSDLWIRSSASSSSSCWCRGRSSWLCCSPPWYRFFTPPSHWTSASELMHLFIIVCSQFMKANQLTYVCFLLANGPFYNLPRSTMKVRTSSTLLVTSSMRPCQTTQSGPGMTASRCFTALKF